ncbi:putative dihydrolipoyllysineresidue acetyltransferase component of pyruvate dehydrogenase complex [Tribonema minus]|uniref:Putative dihydrolipoyllysineresidue acetyltransferase component of pyruvate dehydrogenase complex n=1 Tax=Tribonema minus TaxID=303371 RepID=A0A836CM78_9STRA|nr:putative dihydrolipoyllysineresidue acetyltransferase component of pyruvate dehydrogenase complex [Tribonema minus]
MYRNIARAAISCSRRTGSSSNLRSHGLQHALRAMATLPSHTLVGMPALSPTMEHGNLAKWLKAAGDEIAAGDIICQVETDKATVDFEAQDEGFVAKLLVPEGAQSITVGDPILITVEDKDSVAAFESYEAPATKEAPAPEPEPEPVAAATPPAVSPTPEAEAPKVEAVKPKTMPPPLPPPGAEPVAAKATEAAKSAQKAPDAPAGAPTASVNWGQRVSRSPLYYRLSQEQKLYSSRFGATLQEL